MVGFVCVSQSVREVGFLCFFFGAGAFVVYKRLGCIHILEIL